MAGGDRGGTRGATPTGHILALLAERKGPPPLVAVELDIGRESASDRRIRLQAHAHLEHLTPELYELVDDSERKTMPKKITTTFPKQPDDYDFETEYYGGYRAVACPNGCSVTWEFPRIYETPDRMTAEATCPKCGDEFTIVIEDDAD